jgi:hypothetical protein
MKSNLIPKEEEEDLRILNLVEAVENAVSMFMPLIGLGNLKLEVKEGQLNHPGEVKILIWYFSKSEVLKFGKKQQVKPETIIVDTNAFCHCIESLQLLTEDEIGVLILQVTISEIRAIYRIKTDLEKSQLLDMTVVSKIRELKATDLADEIEAYLTYLFTLTDISEDELLYEIDAVIISVLCMKSLRGHSVETDQAMVSDFLMLTKPEFMASPKSWLALI